jgi:hypothetical protein
MAYSLTGPANRLLAILQGLAGIGGAQIGVPESIGPRVYAYLTAGGAPTGRKATGVLYRDARYRVVFVYRLDGAEATAETTLMGLVDAFLAALHADLTLAGTCEGIEIDAGLADAPEYQIRAGREYREWPLLVTARQYATHTVP